MIRLKPPAIKPAVSYSYLIREKLSGVKLKMLLSQTTEKGKYKEAELL